jgi:hypothetical protein
MRRTRFYTQFAAWQTIARNTQVHSIEQGKCSASRDPGVVSDAPQKDNVLQGPKTPQGFS